MNDISIHHEGKRFLLSNRAMSYAIEIADSGTPWNLYWGAPLSRIEDPPSPRERQCHRHYSPARGAMLYRELPVFGGDFFDESALKITWPDGIRESIFLYTGFEQQENTLILNFREKRHPAQLNLIYRLHERILERFCEIINDSECDITLERFASAVYFLPNAVEQWRITHFGGHWGKESIPSRQAASQGKFTIESRTGLSGPFHVPLIALDDGRAAETSGEVYFATVLWSGNWKITVEQNSYDLTCIHGGINEFDSAVHLHPGERFATPSFAAGYSTEGFSGMSRTLHRWQDEVLLPRGIANREIPMICNTWGSLETRVNEENVIRTAERAAELGCELFVIDDGWQSALGDWTADREKFPNGLRPVIDRVAGLGMKFGLWIEPESFEIASRLYQEHPDWAMAYPGCEPLRKTRSDVGPRPRVSVMLNLAKREVAEHLCATICDLVRTTGIAYLKLDMNCYFTSPGGAERLWIDYARNLDWIFQTVSRTFPSLLMENCASGGARISLQMSRSFGRVNRSDNQDPLDILKLHEGFTSLNHPRMAGGACHISDTMAHVNNRKTPLKFQAYCGMLGSLACGKNLLTCPEQEIAEIRSYVELYKKLRPVIHRGDLYRLVSAFTHPYAVYAYVSQDKAEAVIFVLGMSIQFADKIPPFRVPGLDPDAVYDIVCHGNEIEECWNTAIREYPSVSGALLASAGIRAELTGDYDCKILHLKRKT